MATIVLRATKGSPLTNNEVDANFSNLNIELGNKLPSSSYTASDILTKLKTVDGIDSGLDSDTLRGQKYYVISPGAFAVASVSRSNSVSTIVTSSTHNFVVGDTVKIYGVSPNSFNGSYTISNIVSGTSFTYTQNGESNVSSANQTIAKCFVNITEASIPDRDSNGVLSSPYLVSLTTYSDLVGNVTGDLTGNVTGNSTNVTGVVSITNGGTGATTSSAARSNLGLGDLSTQNSSNVSIGGGTIALSTPLAVTSGGTGANNTTTAKSNLGLNNVTNESKSTMFNNPAFTGTATAASLSVSGTLSAGATSVASLSTSGTLSAGAATVASLSTSGTLSAGAATVASLSTSGTLSAGAATVASLSSNGNVSDDKGNVRSIPANVQASTYTLAVSDIGKSIIASNTVTIPNNAFSAGDAVTIFNNTTGNITITCNTTNTFISGSTTDRASVTLRAYGLATVFFVSGTTSIISGSVS